MAKIDFTNKVINHYKTNGPEVPMFWSKSDFQSLVKFLTEELKFDCSNSENGFMYLGVMCYCITERN